MQRTRRHGGKVRDIKALARRVYERWLEYARRHPGRSIPVDDTLSRLFEHVPAYRPHRQRASLRQDRAAKSPGVFKLQEVADLLETTVADLLGEPGYESPRELLSVTQRRTLRDAVNILRDLFDLDDETLLNERRDDEGSSTHEYTFPVTAEEFIAADYDYPRALRAWVVPEMTEAALWKSGPVADFTLGAQEMPRALHEVLDSRFQVITVRGDSMEPELREGWKVLVETERTDAQDGAIVAVYEKDNGGILGRWHVEDGTPRLRKSNPQYADVVLRANDKWTLWGTVTRIVEAPIDPKRRQ
jgi:hypothetical protein